MIDASMALAWLFDRQDPVDRIRASRLLEACGEVPWRVPSLWQLEISNALLVAERRSVVRSDQGDLFLTRLSALPISTEADALPDQRARIHSLARAHRLSSYDATYLELAQRLGATLASFDRQLNQAAKSIGVRLHEAA